MEAKSMLNELTIAKIKVGSRHRKDMGDPTSLADSIRQNGLLQPIGLSDAIVVRRSLATWVAANGWKLMNRHPLICDRHFHRSHTDLFEALLPRTCHH